MLERWCFPSLPVWMHLCFLSATESLFSVSVCFLDLAWRNDNRVLMLSLFFLKKKFPLWRSCSFGLDEWRTGMAGLPVSTSLDAFVFVLGYDVLWRGCSLSLEKLECRIYLYFFWIYHCEIIIVFWSFLGFFFLPLLFPALSGCLWCVLVRKILFCLDLLDDCFLFVVAEESTNKAEIVL